MSRKVLGLDVGPTSIGWALLNEDDHRILDCGVRIFPEGVDRDQQGGEKSKSQTRRTARGMRRQIARRVRRKAQLGKMLAQAGLLPSEPTALAKLVQSDPYKLRRRALDEKLEPFELGRIFMHLAQRRGFLSNRKTDAARDADAKGMLAEISNLAAAIEQSGSRTLGEYFANLAQRFDHLTSADLDRIRGRHTRREMIEHEFDAIWQAQRRYYPELLTGALRYGARGKQTFPKRPDLPSRNRDLIARYGIHGLIFFQRKMNPPRSIVGRCELEPKQKRCPRADRSAQEFRMRQEINNLRLLDRTTGIERALKQDERDSLYEYLSAAKERTFDQIRKRLRFGESVRFNLERGERDKLKGNETDAILSSSKALGKRWKQLSEETKNRIVDVLIHEDQEHEARQRLVSECGLTLDGAECALRVHLPDAHMSFSRVAIERILPHLRRGLMLMADDETNSALHAAGYLRPDQRAVGQRDSLPPAPDLPNPIVRQALVEVRRVVNALIREYGKPDEIHIELAREAKKSFDERRRLRIDNAQRRRQREAAGNEIEQYRAEIAPTPRTIDKFLLWKEQSEFCVYCGQKISQAQLFNGDADVDHILPRWRSLDNSFANKVVCHRTCNHAKGDQTPRQWLEESDPARYKLVLKVISKLPYNKQLKFQQRDIVLIDFVQRQLRDTAYISRCVMQYVACLGKKIICSRGQMTAELRHRWGLNKILDTEGSGLKNRANHRHHAIDAIVIALTNEKRLHALATARGKDVAEPDIFRTAAERAVQQIRISHRAQGRLSGALHEATLYGATQKCGPDGHKPLGSDRGWAKNWVEDNATFVRRKFVTELVNTKHLEKVRDPAIRNLLREHLRERGIDPDQPGKIPGEAFKGANTPRMPSGVAIKRVRMLEESATFCQVSTRRPYHFVKPGNNHHILYRAVVRSGSVTWNAEVVTMWDAALRAKNGLALIDRSDGPDGLFVMALSIGEMFEINAAGGERLLCVVRKIDQRSKRLFYKLHDDAREAADINADNLYLTPKNLLEREARKVTVDPIGRVRSAR